MTSRWKMLLIAIACIFLCSCEAQQNSDEQETTELPETTATVYEESEVSLKNSETEKSETESIASEIILSSITETKPAETSAAVSLTEVVSEPVYDKDTATVLSVSNIDQKTNFLSWTAIDGAQSYMLYLLNEETGEFEEYGEIQSTSCNDKNLKPNTKYTYAVSAEFPGGKAGKLSEAVSIYTYSKAGSIVQGNYIYYTCDDESDTHYIMRTDRNGEKAEKLLPSDRGMGRVLASEKHIYYAKYGEDSDEIACFDLEGSNEKTLCGFDENFSLEETAVYDDMLFYSCFGASMETDEYTYSLSVLDSNGNAVSGYDNIYDGFYSSISFVYDENDTLYIAWQGEEIDREATENSEYGDIITKPTGNICLFNADTKEKKFIPYTDGEEKRVVQVCGYADGILYVKINGGRFGYISDEGSFVEIELPENSSHQSVEPKSGDIFYEHKEYTDDVTARKELFCFSGGKAQKLADLYCDSGIDLQRYALYGQHILYTNEDRENVVYDLDSGKSLVLNDIM